MFKRKRDPIGDIMNINLVTLVHNTQISLSIGTCAINTKKKKYFSNDGLKNVLEFCEVLTQYCPWLQYRSFMQEISMGNEIYPGPKFTFFPGKAYDFVSVTLSFHFFICDIGIKGGIQHMKEFFKQ